MLYLVLSDLLSQYCYALYNSSSLHDAAWSKRLSAAETTAAYRHRLGVSRENEVGAGQSMIWCLHLQMLGSVVNSVFRDPSHACVIYKTKTFDVCTQSLRLQIYERPSSACQLIDLCPALRWVARLPTVAASVSAGGGDTTVNVLTMAENTLGGALLFFHDMESHGVCTTDFHDCEVQVYVEKLGNSVHLLSWSVERGSYFTHRNIYKLVVHSST